MATNTTQLCNFALALVGEKEIASIDDDDSREANLCKAHFDQTVDEELRSYVWNAAESQQELVKRSEPSKQPLFDYEFIYALPNDPFCLRVLQVNDDVERYRVSGRSLLSDEDKIILRYTKRIIDVNEMDSLLEKVIYTQLAIKIAWPLTQSDRVTSGLIAQYTQLVAPLAKFIDSTENRDVHPGDSDWMRSRGSNRGANARTWID